MRVIRPSRRVERTNDETRVFRKEDSTAPTDPKDVVVVVPIITPRVTKRWARQGTPFPRAAPRLCAAVGGGNELRPSSGPRAATPRARAIGFLICRTRARTRCWPRPPRWNARDAISSTWRSASPGSPRQCTSSRRAWTPSAGARPSTPPPTARLRCARPSRRSSPPAAQGSRRVSARAGSPPARVPISSSASV